MEICGPGPRDHACSFWHGTTQLNPTAVVDAHAGLHLHILAEPRRPEPDDVHLLQRSITPLSAQQCRAAALQNQEPPTSLRLPGPDLVPAISVSRPTLCLEELAPPSSQRSCTIVIDSIDRQAYLLQVPGDDEGLTWSSPRGTQFRFIFPHSLPSTRLFVDEDSLSSVEQSVLIPHWSGSHDAEESERDWMRFLCRKGHRRAFIVSSHRISDQLELVLFADSIGSIEPSPCKLREVTWPPSLPTIAKPSPPFWSQIRPAEDSQTCYLISASQLVPRIF